MQWKGLLVGFNVRGFNNHFIIICIQLEAASRRIKELEEQVALEMQARDEVEHNYRSGKLSF